MADEQSKTSVVLTMGVAAVAKIVDGGPSSMRVVFSRGITSEMFSDHEKPLFEMVRNFWASYGKPPARVLVENKFGIELPHPEESLDYYLDEIRKRYLWEIISQDLDNVREKMDQHDSNGALDILQRIVFRGGVVGKERKLIDASSQFAINEILKEYEEAKIKSGLTGIQTPWASLDEVTGGFQPNELITVVARSSVGKSYLMILIAHMAWMAGKKVLFCSMEMSSNAILRRLYSVHAKIPAMSLLQGKLYEEDELNFRRILHEIVGRTTPFIIVDSFEGTASAVQGLIEEFEPDIVLIDGFYLMKDENKAREKHERVGNITRSIHRVGQKSNVPMIISTQFNREVKMDDLHAELGSIGLSDEIPQLSSLVIAMFRSGKMREAGQMKLVLLKMREGESEPLLLNWNFKDMDFSEMGLISGPTTSGEEEESPQVEF